MGLLAGAMYGAGMAMQEVGMTRLNNLLDQEKRTALMELEQKYANERQDKQIAAAERQIGLQGEETRKTGQATFDRENADRKEIGARVSEYARGREETLPEDQAGPVGYVQPGRRSIAERGEQEAMMRGRPDIATQYRSSANNDLTESEKIDAAARNARELKQTEGSPSETEARLGQAAYARAHADYERGRPQRERALMDRQESANTRQSAAVLMQNGDKMLDNARDERKKLNEEYMGGAPKEGPARADYMARLNRINRMEAQGMSMIERGNAMMEGRAPSGGTAQGMSRPASEEEFLKRDPFISEKPPREGAVLKNGYWVMPNGQYVATSDNRPVRAAPEKSEPPKSAPPARRAASSGLSVPPGAEPDMPQSYNTDLQPPRRRGLLSSQVPWAAYNREEEERKRNNRETVY